MTVRLVVLSDTHLPRRGRSLPSEVWSAVESADAVAHLGDVTGEDFLSELERRSRRLFAVYGNNDGDDVRGRLPARLIMEMAGRRLLLIHGHMGGRTALAAARGVEESVDAVLFGHSHRAYCAVEGNRLLFNPGSPTDRRFSSACSYGVIDFTSVMEPAIVSLAGN